jgi:hypothetical protein
MLLLLLLLATLLKKVLPALPPLAFVCLNFGGSRGSIGMSCILMMRCLAPESHSTAQHSTSAQCKKSIHAKTDCMPATIPDTC